MCSWSEFRTPVKHMVNGTLTGAGGFPDDRDARAEYAKWSSEDANNNLQPVPKLGDAAFCEMTPGGGRSGAVLVILAGQRTLNLIPYEAADDSCETLVKFAALALSKMDR